MECIKVFLSWRCVVKSILGGNRGARRWNHRKLKLGKAANCSKKQFDLKWLYSSTTKCYG